MVSIESLSTIETSNLSLKEPKKLTNGSYAVYLDYNSQSFMLKTPTLTVPFDVKDYQNNKKFKMTLQTTPEIEAKFQQLSEWLIEQMTKDDYQVLMGVDKKTSYGQKKSLEAKCLLF